MQQSQLLKGALDLVVVAALADGESYGYEVLQRLTTAGLEGLGDASVYGALKRLEGLGLLRSRLEASTGGPARRYYAVTRQGKRWFADTSSEWVRFSRAIDTLIATDGG